MTKDQNQNTKTLDVIIIGGGPIGIACALACKKKKLKYLIIEKGALTNSIYNYPLNMSFFSTSEKLELEDIPFITTKPKPKRDEALEYYRRVVTNNKLNIHLYETVTQVLKEEHFSIQTTIQTYIAKNIVIATGFYDIPKYLNVPGENLPKVSHYYKEAHPYSLQDVAIVGASNSAVDAALEIYRKGGHVTMIVRGETIGERVKYWVKPDIINRIKEGNIKAYFNSEILNISEKALEINTSEGAISIKNNFVVALTGYVPNFEFLQSMGVTITGNNKLPQYNPKTMESNIKGVFLAGVICGGLETHKWFIENSRIHAQLIVNAILEK